MRQAEDDVSWLRLHFSEKMSANIQYQTQEDRENISGRRGPFHRQCLPSSFDSQSFPAFRNGTLLHDGTARSSCKKSRNIQSRAMSRSVADESLSQKI
jgi:hypothetical protein